MESSSSSSIAPAAQTLVEYILTDIAQTFGMKNSGLIYETVRRIVYKPALRFAEVLLKLDRSLSAEDVRKSSAIALDYFTDGYEFIDEQNVPKNGPLLVVANHAGAADSIGAFGVVDRKDSSVVAGKRPMLEALPNISRHLLFLEKDPVGRMNDMRQIINRLKKGEAVILFPKGLLEPDPALIPGALQSIRSWSQSVGVFLAKVPETKLLPLLVSQTVAPKAWKSLWATWSRVPRKRQQLAMITQFAMQRLQPGKQWKVPLRVQVGSPYLPDELSNTLDPREINESVQRVMSNLLLSVYPQTA
ncbi:MAG TPA: 1-acyl-sn-glycerol-3-phosphate acyltransferase [Anaerolineaceae bacterium]|nr:hypothetical protein [Chloroflexota bacterium]HNY83586.1 1-acyl-sn-glycerol-3-phosphate acyltransferase [Anaerolineaceae bacterium]